MESIVDRRAYKLWTPVSLRFCDTDALGHINNVAYMAFFESGRSELLFYGIKAISPEGTTFVIVNINIDFRAEMAYPGIADVGTAVKSFGKSSVSLSQALFKRDVQTDSEGDVCNASAQSTLVMIDETTRRPMPIPEATRELLILKST